MVRECEERLRVIRHPLYVEQAGYQRNDEDRGTRDEATLRRLWSYGFYHGRLLVPMRATPCRPRVSVRHRGEGKGRD